MDDELHDILLEAKALLEWASTFKLAGGERVFHHSAARVEEWLKRQADSAAASHE